MKIVSKKLKPRNPLVAAAKLRQAGAHGSHESNRRKRREEKHALRLVLQEHQQQSKNDAY